MRAWLSVLVGAILPVVRHMSMSPDSSGEVSHDVNGQAKAPPATSSRPKPCDDCKHRQRCARDQLACDCFVLFMHSASPARMACAPRQPTRALFEQAHAPVAAPRVYRRPVENDEDEDL